MLKKLPLAAAIAAGLASGAAQALDVNVYGVIDTSIVYEGVDSKDGNGRVNTVYMSSGEEWGSRWGIRGQEDLGNGYTVGFDLQSGIRTDDGTMQYSRAFAREASVYVKGPFGKVHLGRMDSLIGTRTSAGKMAVLSTFGDGYGPYIACIQNVIAEYGYVDNAIFYESPSLNGLTLRLQYSMGPEGVENKSNNVYASDGTVSTEANRYAAASAMYASGPLTLVLGVDRVFYGHAQGEDADDSLTVTFGGNYNFGFMKLHGGIQYMDEALTSTIRKFAWTGVPTKLTGWSATVSAGIPLCGGNLMVGADYLDADAADSLNSDTEVKRMIFSVGYQYSLSRRTHLYAVASVGKDEVKTADEKIKPSYYKTIAGVRHVF